MNPTLLAQASSNPSFPASQGVPKLLPDCVTNGCTELSDVTQLFFNLAEIILAITGVLMLLLFVYGGVLYLTSRGNQQQVSKATSILSGTLIGVAFTFGAYALVDYGVASLTGKVSNTGTSSIADCALKAGKEGQSDAKLSGSDSASYVHENEECGPGLVCIEGACQDPELHRRQQEKEIREATERAADAALAEEEASAEAAEAAEETGPDEE